MMTRVLLLVPLSLLLLEVLFGCSRSGPLADNAEHPTYVSKGNKLVPAEEKAEGITYFVNKGDELLAGGKKPEAYDAYSIAWEYESDNPKLIAALKSLADNSLRSIKDDDLLRLLDMFITIPLEPLQDWPAMVNTRVELRMLADERLVGTWQKVLLCYSLPRENEHSTRTDGKILGGVLQQLKRPEQESINVYCFCEAPRIDLNDVISTYGVPSVTKHYPNGHGHLHYFGRVCLACDMSDKIIAVLLRRPMSEHHIPTQP